MPSEKSKMTPTVFAINVIMTALIFPALILGTAGDWRWLEGWLFALWFEAMIQSSMWYQYLEGPGAAV